MLTALIALALPLQEVQLGSVDVGGRSVTVTVPSTTGPFGENTANVTLDGWKYQITQQGNLGVRYKTDGGWGEVAEFYPPAAVKSSSAPEYRVRVFLFGSTDILEEGRDGIWRERRGTLNQPSLDEIYSALARFKALAETAAEGGVRVTFDVSLDEDTLFRVSRANTREYTNPGIARMTVDEFESSDALLGQQFIHEEIAPRFNNDPFESEDGKYRGPYSSVFVIHPMRTGDVSTFMVDRTPVTSVSWSTFTDRKASEALSIHLFYAWIAHMAATAKESLHSVAVSAPMPRHGGMPHVPHVFSAPLSPELLTLGNHMATPQFGDGRSVGFPYADESINPASRRTFQMSNDRIAVDPAVAPRFASVHKEAKPVQRVRTESLGDWIVFQAPGVQARNDLGALQIQPSSFPAVAMQQPGPEGGDIALTPSGIGDFETSLNAGIVTVNEGGADRRGYAVLAMAEPGKALFRATTDNAIKLRVLSELGDSYVLQLKTRSGQIHDIPVYGDLRVPPEIGPSPLIAVSGPLLHGAQWSDFAASLAPLAGEDIVEVRFAPPKYASYYERETDGSKPVQITGMSVGGFTPTASGPKPMDADLAWVKSLKAPLDAVAVSRLKMIFAARSSNVKLNALAAMNFIQHPDLIPDIAPSAMSASAGEAYLAINALRLQNDDRGWSQIAFAAIRGPLGHSYRFAATALGDKKEDVTLEILGVPLLSRSHYARLAAVKSINGMDTEQAAVVASTAISNGDPDPLVRLALVSKRRPNSELFARRVLWTAVNDESEWVRANAYVSLLDSPFEEVRDQALRGVRDESVAIQLAVLNYMREHPQEHYRSALRMAVIDPKAIVRAAALRAFATQPGEVVIGEVQNTVGDQSPLVQSALKELADKKGLQIPPRP